MKIDIEIKGVDRLEAKIHEICGKFPETLRTSASKAADETKDVAVRLAHGGILKKNIKAEIISIDTGEVISSRVFNDTSRAFWSSYVEFGTGRYVDNEGITDAIRLKRAKKIPWYIHVSMVPPSFAAFGYPRVGDFWEVDGMYPQPYMKPAGFERREANACEIIDGIHQMLKEARI